MFLQCFIPSKITKVGLGKCQDLTELAGEHIFTTIFYTVLHVQKMLLKNTRTQSWVSGRKSCSEDTIIFFKWGRKQNKVIDNG